jgi:hypothetical protein
MSDVAEQTAEARKILASALKSGQKSMDWSYETFMILQEDSLSELYGFIGVRS